MNPAPISRRALVAGVAAIAALATPAGIVEALAAETPPAEAAGALPAVFDPAAFVADLAAAGYGVFLVQNVPRPGCAATPAHYVVTPPKGHGFNQGYGEVMARWADRLDATPDHVEQVVRYASDQLGAAA